GVAGERLELVGEARLGLDERVGDGLDVLSEAAGELELPGVDDAFVQADPAAVFDLEQGLGADVVDQRDAGVDEDLRPEVGKTPGDRRRRYGGRRGPCPRRRVARAGCAAAGRTASCADCDIRSRQFREATPTPTGTPESSFPGRRVPVLPTVSGASRHGESGDLAPS